MRLDSYIAELLIDHDCVIVPDFGGFVANYAPATVNQFSHRFDPPHRKISFNKLLVHNDGLLAAYVARKEQERYEDAVKDVKNYVLYLREELKANKKVSIDKVGILLLQQDGTYRFEQVKNPDFFQEGFGLESFFGKPISRKVVATPAVEPKADRVETIQTPVRPTEEAKPKPVTPIVEKKKVETEKVAPEPKVVKLEPENEVTEQEEPKRKRRYMPAVAAILGLPIVAYAAWIAMSTTLITDRSQFHYSDLNPFGPRMETDYVERVGLFEVAPLSEEEPLIIDETEEFLSLTRDNEPDKTLVVRLIEPEKGMATTGDLPYHIIGGCFSVDSNADRMVDRYRGLGTNASIIDKKGALSRVSIASYATKKEALLALASYQNEIPGAWLLYK